jgi:hypothetical protein
MQRCVFPFAARRVFVLLFAPHIAILLLGAQMSAKSAARSLAHTLCCEAALFSLSFLSRSPCAQRVLHARLMDNGAGLQRVCSKNGAKVLAISLFSQSAQSLCAPEMYNGRIFSVQFNWETTADVQ